MPDLIPINILVGDRTYRIKAEPQHEELIRKTLKTINDKILEYKTQFAGKDMQDYIAMVVIWYATQAADPANAAGADILKALNSMEEMLDSN